MALTSETKVIRAPGVIAAKLGDGKLALLGGDMSHYYGIEGTGLRIWELIESKTTIGEVCELLAREYDVDRDTCWAETVAFVSSLVSEKLVAVG